MSKTRVPSSVVQGVKLSNGKLSLKFSLLNEVGIQGVNLILDLTYTSDVAEEAVTWNREAPTNEIGLGWNLPLMMVTCDTQGVGGALGHRYFLNGAKLLPIENDSGSNLLSFVSEKDLLWKISFDQSSNSWTIVKENGLTYICGGTQDSIVWGLRVNNWVGTSNRSDLKSTPLALVYKLSQIKNLAGETINYSYITVQAPINNLGDTNEIMVPKFTQASYLCGIKTSHGDNVAFNYALKTADEYPPQAIGALQQPHYTNYLQSLIFTSATGKVKTIVLTSVTANAKRLLRSIAVYGEAITSFPVNDASTPPLSPPTSFKYGFDDGVTDLSNPLFGMLTQVVYPSGKHVTYSYLTNRHTDAQPFNSQTALTQEISNPSGYHVPRIFFGPGYVVCLWLSKDTPNKLQPQIYYWDQCWKTVSNLDVILTNNVNLTQVVTENDYFAVIYSGDATNYNPHANNIRFYQRLQSSRGEWVASNFDAYLPSGSNNDKGTNVHQEVAAGSNFLFLLDEGDQKHAPQLTFFQHYDTPPAGRNSLNQCNWFKQDLPSSFKGFELGDKVKMYGEANYCLAVQVHSSGYSPVLHLFYVTPSGKLGYYTQSTNQFQSATKVKSFDISGSPSFVIVDYALSDGTHNMTFYQWNEDFTNIIVEPGVGPTNPTMSCTVLGDLVDFGADQYVAKFDGGTLYKSGHLVGSDPSVGEVNNGDRLGYDCVLASHIKPGKGNENIQVYDMFQYYLSGNNEGWNDSPIFTFTIGKRDTFWQLLKHYFLDMLDHTVKKLLHPLKPFVPKRFRYMLEKMLHHPTGPGFGNYGLCGMTYLLGGSSVYFQDQADPSKWSTIVENLLQKGEELKYNIVQFCDYFAVVTVKESDKNNTIGIRVLMMKNGKVTVSDLISGQSAQPSTNAGTFNQMLYGTDSFLSYPSSQTSIESSNSFTLYKILGDDYGSSTDYVVSNIQVQDGFRTEAPYQINYVSASAQVGEGGWQYNEVYLNRGQAVQDAFIAYYFYAGAALDQLVASGTQGGYPNLEAMTGALYKVEVFDISNGGSLIAEDTYQWQQFRTTGSPQQDRYYKRVNQIVRQIDQESNRVNISYYGSGTSNQGMISQSKTTITELSKTDGTIVSTTYSTSVKYANQVYPALASLNLLKGVYQREFSQKEASLQNDNPILQQRTVWQQDSTGEWIAWQQFCTRSGQQANTDVSTWAKLSEVKQASNGVVRETVDALGVVQSVLYDKTDRFSLATFQNGSVAEGECLYLSFETYQEGADLSGWTVSMPNSRSAVAHTGGKSLSLSATQILSLASAKFSATKSLRQRVCFFACREDGKTLTLNDLRLNVNQGVATVSLIAANSNNENYQQSGWKYFVFYFEATLSAGESYQIVLTANAGVLIDDFLVSPVDTLASLTAYDPILMIAIASIENNGSTQQVFLDEKQQIVAMISNNQPVSLGSSNYGRQLQQDGSYQFLTSSGNSQLSLSSGSGGYVYATCENGSLDLSGAGNPWQSGSQFALDATSSAGVLTLKPGDINEGYAFQFKLSDVQFQNNPSGPYIRVATPGGVIIWDNMSCSVNPWPANTLPKSYSVPNYGSVWLVVFIKNQFFLVIDGSVCIACAFTPGTAPISNATGPNIISIQGGRTTTFTVKDAIFMRAPQLSRLFADGLGRTRQTLELIPVVDGGATVTMLRQETVYDIYGRQSLTTLPAAQPDSTFSFNPNFISNRLDVEWGTSPLSGRSPELKGDILTGLDSDVRNIVGGYPYTQSVYEYNALSRVRALTSPDPGFIYKGPETKDMTQAIYLQSSDKNSSGNAAKLSQYLAGCLTAAKISESFVPADWSVLATDQQGADTALTTQSSRKITVKDAFGRPVLAAVFANSSQNLMKSLSGSYVPSILTLTAYANLTGRADGGALQVTKALPVTYGPNGPAVTREAQYATQILDSWGRLIESQDPDRGDAKMVYDDRKQLRFIQDTESLQPTNGSVPYFKYIKYDDLGRVVEIGTCPLSQLGGSGFNGLTDFTDSRRNDVGYPDPSVCTVHRVWVYDFDPTSPSSQLATLPGELVSTKDQISGIQESYKYDLQGQVTDHTILTTSNQHDFSVGALTTSYEYDLMGRMAAIHYPQSGPVMRAHYNLAGQLDEIQVWDAHQSQKLSSFEFGYNLLGQVQKESIIQNGSNSLTTTRNYDNFANLIKLDAPNLFTETLVYKDATTSLTSLGKILSREDSFPNAPYNKPQSGYQYPSGQLTFQYDPKGEYLTAVGSPSSLLGQQVGFSSQPGQTYDANGNILGILTNAADLQQGGTFQYLPDRNQVSNITMGKSVTPLKHDGVGRLTTIQFPTNSISFVYDPFTNQPVSVGGTPVLYDSRAERFVSNGRLTARGVGTKPLLNLSTKKSSGQYYIYGPTGLLMVLDGSNHYYTLRDYQGSVRVILDTTMMPKATHHYHPYGQMVTSAGYNSSKVSTPPLTFSDGSSFNQLFCGMEYYFVAAGDPYETAFSYYYNHARLYAPQWGRFLTPDVAKSDPSPYVYCGNDPINFVDPNGLARIPILHFLGNSEATKYTMEIKPKIYFTRSGARRFQLAGEGNGNLIVMGTPQETTWTFDGNEIQSLIKGNFKDVLTKSSWKNLKKLNEGEGEFFFTKRTIARKGTGANQLESNRLYLERTPEGFRIRSLEDVADLEQRGVRQVGLQDIPAQPDPNIPPAAEPVPPPAPAHVEQGADLHTGPEWMGEGAGGVEEDIALDMLTFL
jgi:RHS repeat-associated protein